jgi:hypothetical protein
MITFICNLCQKIWLRDLTLFLRNKLNNYFCPEHPVELFGRTDRKKNMLRQTYNEFKNLYADIITFVKQKVKLV